MFSSHLILRKFFRNIVLPVDKIKDICRGVFISNEITSILDFGSGTFFWTDWFVQEFGCQIYAVDAYYKNLSIEKQNVKCYSNFDLCLDDCQNFSVAFACDVLHHLTETEYEQFIKKIMGRTKIIIIKDVDANHVLGNFMNKMHDKVINKEKVRNIYPDKIKNTLELFGYKTHYYYIPKLWYSHFLLIGVIRNSALPITPLPLSFLR
jgi:cyclopropane fatty-acyl-phospholipid synthase-like methyltransferase